MEFGEKSRAPEARFSPVVVVLMMLAAAGLGAARASAAACTTTIFFYDLKAVSLSVAADSSSTPWRSTSLGLGASSASQRWFSNPGDCPASIQPWTTQYAVLIYVPNSVPKQQEQLANCEHLALIAQSDSDRYTFKIWVVTDDDDTGSQSTWDQTGASYTYVLNDFSSLTCRLELK